MAERQWSTWIGDYATTATAHRVSSIDAILRCVNTALSDRRKARAVGHGHSFSPVAAPAFEGEYVDMQEPLNRRGMTPESRGLTGLSQRVDYLRPNPPLEQGEHLVRVMAGTRIKTLNRIYLPDSTPALGMPNLGTYDGQTLAGVVNTGTHGTGLRKGAIADLVLSMDIVSTELAAGVRPVVHHLRIEPTNGITDPAQFQAAAASHGMRLYQDDNLFYAMVVGFGCMGIATSYVLKVREQYWLREESSIVDFPVQCRRMADIVRETGFGAFPREVDQAAHYWFLINVAEMQGKHAHNNAACLVIRRNETTQTVLTHHDRQWPERRTEIDTWFGEKLGTPHPDQDNDGLGAKIRGHFARLAQKLPFGPGRYDSTVSYIAHRRERDSSVPDQAAIPPPEAISQEIAVPAEQLHDVLTVLAETMKRSRFFYQIPWGVRFVAPSRHYLAAHYGRPTAYIETPLKVTRSGTGGKRDNTRDELLKPMLEALETAVCYSGRFDARPHLGKYNSINHERLMQAYPQAGLWLSVARRFNALGVFSNRFSDQIGL